MKISDVKKVCVVGGGLMGRQIALNAALYGFDTCLNDAIPEVLESVASWEDEYFASRIAKNKLTADQASVAKAKFHTVQNFEEAVKDTQIVIEAILEDKEVKTNFYKQLNNHIGKDTVIASNSSYMVSSLFKDCIDNPSRLANMHYFNPALAMKLVEVVKGEHTSRETADFLYEFAIANGKKPIRVNKEIRGFVVNRILTAIRDEAYFLVEEGICSPEDCDIGVKGGLNHPMGPFELLDLTGIDLNYLSMVDRMNAGEPEPHGFEIAKAKYEAHEWGRKSGKGFYDYSTK
jgi:3-hydroxybutyryl-CoA dehydrogenase